MKIAIVIFCFLFISCESQDKENPKYLGKEFGIFKIDRVSFNEDKDVLFSKVDIYMTDTENKINTYTIKDSKNLALQLGGIDIKTNQLQWSINSQLNKISKIELQIFDSNKDCKKILKGLENNYQKLDLTDRESINRSKKFNFGSYVYTYLFKDNTKYIIVDHVIYDEKEENDLLQIKIYKYPFDKDLIEEHQVDKRIINK
ncbi:MAG TPA: hypothetical protein VF677_10860 [Flavobacterium sp.]|jgi:hypothetical protein